MTKTALKSFPNERQKNFQTKNGDLSDQKNFFLPPSHDQWSIRNRTWGMKIVFSVPHSDPSDQTNFPSHKIVFPVTKKLFESEEACPWPNFSLTTATLTNFSLRSSMTCLQSYLHTIHITFLPLTRAAVAYIPSAKRDKKITTNLIAS